MFRLLAILAVMLGAWPAWSSPQVTTGKTPASSTSHTITFRIGDTDDSPAMEVSGFCSVRYQQESGDDASLYAVTSVTTAAASGTLIGAFTSSTTEATTFTAGTRWVKAVATDETAGGSVMQIDCAPLTGGGGGGVLGSGPLADMLAANATAGDLWQQTDDNGGDCATGSGTDPALLCQYDGASWIPAGIAGGTDNLGNHTATTDLDLDGNDITGVATAEVTTLDVGMIEQQPIYYVENYYVSDWLDAINDALAACDTAAEVDSNAGKPGIVMLPRGRTVYTVTSANTSPLILLPEVGNDSDDNRYASCELRGWGSAPGQLFNNAKSASMLYFYNPDSMVDGADGRNVIIEATGYGQVIKEFTLGTSGAADTDTDDTTAILLRSTARGAYAAGEYGIKDWEISGIDFKSARARTGDALETIFSLNGRVLNNEFSSWATGWLLTTQSGTANNANLVQGNRFAGNTVAIDIPGVLSCQDFYLNGGNTIEANAYGIRLRADATCRVFSFGTHWEQDYTVTPAGVNDVLIENDDSMLFSLGDFWDSVFNANAVTSAADHIERTVANAATNPPDMVIGGAFRGNEDGIYTYAAGGRIVVNENYTAATLGLPRASDCSVSPHSTDGNACVDSDDESLWISGVEITGGGGSGTLTGDGTATYIPYYSASQVLANEAAFAYNAGSNTLTVGAVSSTSTTGGTVTGTTSVVAGVDNTTTGSLTLHHASDGSLIITPPDTASDTVYTFPVDGTDGYQLTTNGAGVLRWDVAGGGGSFDDFLAAGDSGTPEAISDGQTLSILGGTNGVDTVVSATDTVTINLDLTEISGTASSLTAGVAQTVTFADAASDTTTSVALGTSATGNLAPATDAGLTYNASTNVLTASGGFSGALTGNVTGNASTVTFADAASDTTTSVALGTSATGSLAPATDAGLTYNASTNVLTASGGFVGALTGNASTVTFADAASDTTTFVALGTAATGSLAPATDAGLAYNASTNALTIGGAVSAGDIDSTGAVTATSFTADDPGDGTRGIQFTTNTAAIGAGDAGECTLGFVGTTLNKHCNGGSLTSLESGSGDITDVGPGYASGAAFTDGVTSTGSNLFVWEGAVSDVNEWTLAFADADPSADVLWTIPDAAASLTFPSGTDTLVGKATTDTLTNKTYNAESTGNVLTTVERIWFPAAGCNNATAASFYDLPTANAAAPACVTGTNTQKGVLDFDTTTSESAQVTHMLPSDWTGTVDVNIKWFAAATTSSVAWNVASICVADAETDDPAFNTASAVVDGAKGTTNQTNDAAITTLTVTGCAAGELLHLKISRDVANGSDAMSGDARLIGFELVYRRAI